MIIKCIKVGYLQTNCYILELNDKCLIIDPGDETKKIINNIDCKVVGILITHNHFDHIGALKELMDFYNVNKYDYNDLNEGLNKIDCFQFIVKYNLGHTMDSISFIFDNLMFGGDFVFKDGIGRCDLGGNISLMKKSISSLLESNENYKILPGHGEETTLKEEIKFLNQIKNTL